MAVKGFMLQIDEDTCTGCGNCIVTCPVNALDLDDHMGVDSGKVNLYNRDFCTGCGNCMKACAHNAIEVSTSLPVEISKFEKVKDFLYGKNSEIYRMIKSNGPLTLAQVAEGMDISAREVSLHVHALKNINKLHEYGKVDGKYTYSTQKAKKEARGIKEEVRTKTSPEIARKIKEKLDAAIETFNTLKVRVLLESDKLEKAKSEIVKSGKND